MSQSSVAFRYVRFVHNSNSQCNLAEMQLFGIIYSDLTPTLDSFTSFVVYRDGFNAVKWSGDVVYKQEDTAIITDVSPQYGDIFGGYTLTLTGTNLNAAAANIMIDGIECTNPVASGTSQVTCTVGPRPNLPQ